MTSRKLWLWVALHSTGIIQPLTAALVTNTGGKDFNYFAYGSNVCLSTMTNLRGIDPVASTAAVLSNHELRFNIPGVPFIEPSWASVEPVEGELVHGVLYRLTEQDFNAVCRSEGVPIGYVLHRCRPIPYIGNGRDAGQQSLVRGKSGVSAFTLRAPAQLRRPKKYDIAPSKSYLDVILRGAEEYRLDEEYIEYLCKIERGTTLIGDGTAYEILKSAERRNR